ncbi:hypothetical protein D5085_07055 [Ectothiorhodospiraceae bacterium BW-2]|nr:hypothetical protein D5085_07055 [Ectothiorhodospiraceae bacterium BW-2]
MNHPNATSCKLMGMLSIVLLNSGCLTMMTHSPAPGMGEQAAVVPPPASAPVVAITQTGTPQPQLGPQLAVAQGGAAPVTAIEQNRLSQQWQVHLPQGRRTEAVVEQAFVDNRDGISFGAVMRESGIQAVVTRHIGRTWVFNPQLNEHYWQCNSLGEFEVRGINYYEREEPFDPAVIDHNPRHAGGSALGQHISGLYKVDPYEAILTPPTPASMVKKPTVQQAFPRDQGNRYLAVIKIYPVTVTPRYPGAVAAINVEPPPAMANDFCRVTDNLPLDQGSYLRTAALVGQHTQQFIDNLLANHNPAVEEGESMVTFFADWSELPNKVAEFNPNYQLLTFEVRNSLSEYPLESPELLFKGVEPYLLSNEQLQEIFMLGFQDVRIRQSLQIQVDSLIGSIQNQVVSSDVAFTPPLRMALLPGEKSFLVKGLHPDYIARTFTLELNGSEQHSTLYLDPIGAIQRSVELKESARAVIR